MTIIVTDRPTAKTIGHTGYERYRRKQIAYGRWDRWVDPQPVREHILALRRRGIGRDSLARHAGVTEHTIRRIVSGRTTKVHITCADKILAVTDPQMPYVDATGARRRLQALGTLGWDQSTLAERIGWSVKNLNLIVSGNRKNIVPATADLIHRLYDELSGTVAPASRRASHALASARRNNWVSPLAWDDDTIDDPNEQPNLGDTKRSGDYDETTVGQACEGRLTYAQIAVHRPDLIETVRRLAKTLTDQEIGHLLRWPGANDQRTARSPSRATNSITKVRLDNGIPACSRPASIAPRIRRRTTQAA